MKKLVFVLLLLSVFIIKIPKYQELNNIKIIDKIELNYTNNIYKFTIREIIPKRSVGGITYYYKEYFYQDKNLNKVLSNLNNKIYYDQAKIITNIKNLDIKKYLYEL